MKTFLQNYWEQALFLAFVAIVTASIKNLYSRGKTTLADQCMIKEGVLAILHDRLYQNCAYHISQEFCTLEDRKNLEYMFKAYHGLGGNGTCQDIYERCCSLPYVNPNTPKPFECIENKKGVK